MKVIIIGAGPCGIMAAIEIKKNNPSYQVILLEKDSRSIGSRIKVSGNGRCNLTNINLTSKNYNVNIDNFNNTIEAVDEYIKNSN